MSALPKPILRGHVKRRGLKSILGAACVAVVNAAAYHFLVTVPRREAYENFVKEYDPKAHYNDLVKWGYISFSSILEEKKNS